MSLILRALRRRPIISAVLAIVLAAAALVVWNLSRPANDAQVDAIRAKGYPATLAELDASYKSPRPDENAALMYTKAFARPLLASNLADPFISRDWLPERGTPIADEDKSEFRALLATNQEAMDLLYTAAALPACRYPIDITLGYNTLLPHLAAIKRAATILSNDGLLHAQEGHGDEAVRAFMAASRVAESVSQEPLLISQLVRYAAWNLICLRLEHALNTTAFDAKQLGQLQEIVAQGENPRSLALALIGEQANGVAVFTDPETQAGIFGLGSGSGKTTQSERLRAQFAVGLLKTTGIFAKDKAFFLDSLSNAVAMAELPFPERWKRSPSAFSPVPTNRFYLFSRMILPALSKTAAREAEHVARIRVAQTALAVERFRRGDMNRLPDDLTELVPSCISAVPTDPFDGSPIRYRKLTQGYVVYSIGADGVDHGAAQSDSTNRKTPQDLTLTVGR